MKSRNDPIIEAAAAFFTVLLVCAAIVLIPASLWYCFDDSLAKATGVDGLGHVGFGGVYAFCLFVTFLCNMKLSSSTKES